MNKATTDIVLVGLLAFSLCIAIDVRLLYSDSKRKSWSPTITLLLGVGILAYTMVMVLK